MSDNERVKRSMTDPTGAPLNELDGDQVMQLNGAPVPERFAPLAAWDFKRSKLSLWLFHQQTSRAAPPDEEHGQRGGDS